MDKFKTLKDHVYDYIAGEIQVGRLIPDQRINESVICDELKISRTPVREALIQLAAEGILENKARRGFVIKTLSPEDACELYEVIGLLDGFAAKKACDYLSKQDCSDMQFYVDTMSIAIDSGNFEMYCKQQLLFHDLYTKKCGNSILAASIAQYKNKLLKMTYVDDPEGKTRKVLHENNKEHQEIVNLFSEHKADELFTYISEVHWRSTNVEYDLIV